jgi:benzoate transport
MDDPRLTIAREPMHHRQIIAVGIATLLNGLDGFDILSISFAAPGIARQWGITRAALGVVLSMELVGMGIGALFLGAMADRHGRRPTILACLGIMAVGMALASTASDVVVMSVYRLVTGLGIGGMLAATNAVAAEYANARQRNLSVAVMAAGYPIGAILGGSASAWLLGETGRWQSIFQFGAVLTISFIPLVLWLLPETLAFLVHRRPRDALKRINRLLVRQGREAVSSLPPEEPRNRGFQMVSLFSDGLAPSTVLLTLAYFSHMMTFYFLLKWIPKIVADLGYSPALAGSVLVWASAGGAAGSILLSILNGNLGLKRMVIGAMFCGAATVALFGQDLSTLASLSYAACLAGFFTNGATAGLYGLLAQSFPASLRAGGTGFVIGIGRAGAALGPILAGALFSGGWQLPSVAIVMALGSALGGILLLALNYRQSA